MSELLSMFLFSPQSEDLLWLITKENKRFPVFWETEDTVSGLLLHVSVWGRCCIVVNGAWMLLATTTCWPAAAMQSDPALWRAHKALVLQHIRRYRSCAEVCHIITVRIVSSGLRFSYIFVSRYRKSTSKSETISCFSFLCPIRANWLLGLLRRLNRAVERSDLSALYWN